MGKWSYDGDKDWVHSSSEGLQYSNFERNANWTFGTEYGMDGGVFSSSEENAAFQYLVLFGGIYRAEAIQVVDFPSLLMLMKEIEPFVKMCVERDLREE
jgi:hypothetical protein